MRTRWQLLLTGSLALLLGCGGEPGDPPPQDPGCLADDDSGCGGGPSVECLGERPAAGGDPALGGVVDAAAPTVMNIHPCSGAVGVDASSRIRVAFSKDVDAASLTTSTFVVSKGGQRVVGALGLQGKVATFLPMEKLTLGQSYEVLVTTGVRGVDGKPLVSEYSWTFTVREGLWAAPTRLEADDRGSAYDAQLAADAQGNVLAAWLQFDGTHTNLYARRYSVATGWEAGSRVVSEERGSASRFALAMNARGEAIALWTQWYQSLSRLWTSFSSSTTPWTAPSVVEPQASQVLSPAVAIDRNGNGMAIWLHGSEPAHLWGGQYLNTVGWVDMRTLSSLDMGGSEEPQVATDGFGNVTVVWLQRDGAQKALWMRRFAPDIGWGEVQRLKPAESLDAVSPRLAVDANGGAMVVWQSRQTPQRVYSVRYAPGVGWEAVRQVAQLDVGQLSALAIAGEPGGRVTAVWSQGDETRGSIWASRYEVGGGWGAAARLSPTDVERSQEPAVAMDGNGNAVAAWFQIHGTTTQLWAARSASGGGGWGTLTRVDSSGNAITPKVVMDSSGRATIVWSQYAGNHFDLWTSRFE